MSNVPTNLIPTRITGLPEYTGTSTLGYMAYVLEGRTYKVQFSNIAAVGAVPSSRVIGTGNGLEGGGDLSQNRVISIIPHGVGYSQLDFTGVTAGTYGSADTIPSLTIDATGRVTAAVNTPVVLSNYVPSSRTVTAGAGLTGGGQLNNNITIALNPSNATPQSLGVASAGTGAQAARDDHVHPAVDLTDTSETQGVLPLGRGGTGVALSPVVGAVIYADNDSLNQTIAGNAGQILKSAGGLGAPYWDDLIGGGTVTSVSVVTANGFAGTVANSSTTPAITLTTTVSGLVKGNGSALSAAIAGTDYVAPGAVTTSGLTMATDRLLGRTTASTGAVEEITVGSGLSLSAGSLTNSAPDQIVSLTGAGTTVVTGTYPSFTITSNDQYVGTVTSVGLSGGTTGLSVSGTNPITTSGTFTLGGTLVAANGGTGFASYTTGDMLYASGSTALSKLSIGSNTFILTSTGSAPQWSNPTGVTIGTATNLAGGASGSIPYQSAAGATTFLASGTGVLVNSAGNPSYTMTPSLTQVTVAGNPSAALEVATKQYVDNLVSSGISYHTPVKYEVPNTTGNLTAIYNQPGGAGVGVGATLTNNGTKAAFAPDGPTAQVGDRVLIYNQTNAFENGVYTVTTVGTPDPGGTNWVLTRATDADTYGLKDPNALGNGDAFFVTSGDTGAGETYVLNTTGVITFGTTALTFVQVSDATLYTAGNGLQLTSGTVFSLISPVVTSNGGTGLTSFTSGGAVYATSTSALTTGTLPATAGGTGQSSYAVGDLLYASTTSALSRLADVATGNALISGGVNTAPSWGKIGLTTHVSGVLEVGNGGTGASTLTANGILLGNGTSAISATAVGATGQVLVGNTGAAPSWATLSSSAVTSFSAGTTGFTPSTGTTGAITLAGTLNVANGGTGATTLTGYVKGNGTSAFTASATIPASEISSGAALTKTNDTNVTLTLGGSPSTALLAATSLTLGWTGQLGVTRGGTGTGTAFTAGSIVFAGASGVYSQDNANLFWDDSNNRLGIGTTSPGYAVEVTGDLRLGGGGDLRLGSATGTTGSSGDSSIFSDANDMYFSTGSNTRMYIANGGNVGIGNTGPTYRLDVSSADTTANLGYAMRIRANATAGGGTFQFTDSGATAQWGFLAATSTTVTLDCSTAGSVVFRTNGSERGRFNSSGNLLVGTTTDKNRLTVTAGANTNSPTLGSAGGIAYFTNPDVSYGLNIGNSAVDGRVWLQAQRTDGSATAYNITLNEAGGNVGIGLTSPGFKLDVSGDAHTSGSVFTGSNTDGWGRFVNSGGALYIQAGSLNSGSATAQPVIFTNMYGGAERMRLNSAGKLLLGTSADADGAPFQVNAASFGNGIYTARFENSDTGTGVYNAVRWLQGASGSAVGIIGTGGSTTGNSAWQNRFVIGTQNNTALCFISNDAFRGMIDGGGQFWWGAQSTIDTVSYAPFQITNALAINTNTTSGTTAVSFFNGQGSGVRVGYIGTSGSSTSYNTSSDARLKENIADAADAGSVIDAIQVRQFDWKINGEHQRYGMIAQELDLVFPEAVGHGPTEEDMLAVDYSKLVPMLVKELQSVRARLAELEGK